MHVFFATLRWREHFGATNFQVIQDVIDGIDTQLSEQQKRARPVLCGEERLGGKKVADEPNMAVFEPSTMCDLGRSEFASDIGSGGHCQARGISSAGPVSWNRLNKLGIFALLRRSLVGVSSALGNNLTLLLPLELNSTHDIVLHPAQITTQVPQAMFLAMPVTYVLRGFKISVPTLDAFLAANGLDMTYGASPFYDHHPDQDPISRFFHSKLGANDPGKKTRLIISQRVGMDYSTVAYVAYTWIMVYAHRELPEDGDEFSKNVPAGFEDLRQEVLGFAAPDARRETEGELWLMGMKVAWGNMSSSPRRAFPERLQFSSNAGR